MLWSLINMEDKKPIATVTDIKTKKEIDFSSMEKLVHDLERDRIAGIARSLSGQRIMLDDSGMMCGPNEMVIFVGKNLYKKLEEFCIEEKNKINS